MTPSTQGATGETRFRVPAVGGLVRQRVLETLRQAVDSHPLTVLTAPAGSGKTTALVQFATSTTRSHAWYRATASQTRPRDLMGHLARALHQVVDGLPAGLAEVEETGAALARVRSPVPTVLLVDDLHELAGSAAEQMLEHFVRVLPDWLRVLAATRHTPGFNHPAMQLSGDLVAVTEDVLRWRPWEVERLFRDYYRMRLGPEEAARLTHRTEGWAAGLKLFHLASEHLPLAGRTQLIDGLHTRPGLVRDYLTHNVLSGLPTALRDFLIDTCVLGKLDARLCDDLRGRNDSARLLAELEDKRLFVLPRDDGCGYRYHEVLRAHLEVSLMERDGTMAARARFQRAGQLLESDGAVAEALHAFARAEAWQDVARLLGSDGPTLARGGQTVVADLPRALVAADPWLRLAQARALVGDGRLKAAREAFRDAERAFGDLPSARICRDERAALDPWVQMRERPPRTLTDLLRAAVRRDPRRHAAAALTAQTPNGLLVAAAAALLAGDVDQARRYAAAAGSRADTEVFTIAAARALEHLASVAAGLPDEPGDLPWAAETFEQLGFTWLARLARTIVNARTENGLDEIATMWDLLDDQADPWGPPILRLVAGIAAVVHGRPNPAWLDEAAHHFRRLEAGTLETWARAWEALARAMSGEPEPVAAAEQARSLARHAQVPGAEAIAELAIAVTDDPRSDDARQRANALARDLGVALPQVMRRPADTPLQVAERAPTARVTCFGGLGLTFAGRPIDLTALKPQSRALLALVSLHAGEPVHRDRLIDALWHGEDHACSHRRLTVLVSTVRRHLEPDTEPGDWSLLVRQGEAYLLRPPAGAFVDVRAVDQAAAAAREAHARKDRAAEMDGHRAVLATCRGELLPEFGATEWVVEDRDHYRVQVVIAAQALAAWHLADGDASACIEVARAGLRVDRYRSQLWHLLADAHRSVGDVAAAAHAEEEHAAILETLGVGPSNGHPRASPISLRASRAQGVGSR